MAVTNQWQNLQQLLASPVSVMTSLTGYLGKQRKLEWSEWHHIYVVHLEFKAVTICFWQRYKSGNMCFVKQWFYKK
jgi:hypothetical protein